MDESRSIKFHISEDVLPADELKGCVAEFLDLLKDATNDCMSDIQWFASVKNGSIALAAYPDSSTETNTEIDECLSAIHNDFVCIRGGKPPALFSDKTLDRYQRLVKILTINGKLKGEPTIQVVSPKIKNQAPVSMGPMIVKKTEPIKAFGTAYGIVKSLSAVGTQYLALYDEVTKQRIKVFYDDNMIDEVRKSYKNRVRVTGEILYSEDGIKKEIKAFEIKLEDEDDIPVRFLDLFGILGGDTR
ncbi:hypothetical protein [Eggerthella sp. YY7918]|uniref:hypothetical protein n=1 Tax=Eggerthella sp. (strain YY7918) TaxID=502558 RepID=UPI0002171030|nr:hypothetical protein [Eggerthella sp. YY7918]BAK43389.1 hypothetical protein EGYY_01280 [Eggerthella sp. YY7918]